MQEPFAEAGFPPGRRMAAQCYPSEETIMNWTHLLQQEIENAYTTTAKLLDKVDSDKLDWKPPSGSNWMTLGQLLKHITESCGAGCKGFVTGDWGLPPGMKMDDLQPDQMLPPAEKLPSIGSVDEARKLLAEDRSMALRMIAQAGEDQLANRSLPVPWDTATELVLGRHLLQMIKHLERHSAQLFYYLKLQGKPVNTADLWG
jgi:hypothetical protein